MIELYPKKNNPNYNNLIFLLKFSNLVHCQLTGKLKTYVMKAKILQRAKFMQYTVSLLIFHLFFVSCTNEPELPTTDEAKTAVMEKITMAAEKWSQGEPMGYVDCAAKDIVWLDELGAFKQ